MSARLVHHPLADAVGAMLPAGHQTDLLRAVVDDGVSGRQALERWLAAHQDAVAAITAPAVKWLMPLVFRACLRHGSTADASLQTVLKAAALREELRVPAFRAIRDRAIAALRDAGADPVVIRGAALGELVYPDLSLRHSHDVELVVERLEWAHALAALSPCGFTASPPPTGASRVELTHISGLPLVLHRRLFRVPFYNATPDDMLARTERLGLGRTPVRVLAPADAVLHSCGQAVHAASRDSLRWIVDAWFVLNGRRDVDWDRLIATAGARSLALPATVMMQYLRDALDAAVPPGVCDALMAAAVADRSVGPELALYGARAASGGGLLHLMQRTESIRNRAAVLTYLLLPSPRFLAWKTRPRAAWLRAAHRRALQPLRFIERRTIGSR